MLQRAVEEVDDHFMGVRDPREVSTEERLTRLNELATDLMIVTDVNGTILHVNPAITMLHGISAEEAIGMGLHDFLPPESHATLLAIPDRWKETKRPVPFQMRAVGADGQEILVEGVTSWDEETQSFYTIERNITGDLRQRRDLRIAEALFGLAGDALAMLDETQRVVKHNQAFDELFEELDPHGARLIDLPGFADHPDLAEQLRNLSNEHPTLKVDVEIDLFGTPRTMDSTVHLDEDGTTHFLVARDVTEERRLHSALQRQATRDHLTDLANRSVFAETLSEALRQNNLHGLLLVDLDGFKPVNDNFGHAVGDSLLQIVADRLRANTRESDFVARLGGDEFVVLIQGTSNESTLAHIGESLQTRLSQPYEIDGHRIDVTASIGIAPSQPGGSTASELMRQADLALYDAKGDGRNTFAIYDHRLRASFERRRVVETEFIGALQNGELDVDVQSIYAIGTGKIAAVEGLARWAHPIRGRLGPSAFLDIATDKGLAMAITEQILFQLFDGLSDWLRAPEEPRVAVNITPRQLRDPKLLETLSSLTREFGIRPAQVVCEFVEEALVDSIGQTAARLEDLCGAGFRIAIDDFGAGASSIGYFRDFPVDYVKIDRRLFEQIPHNSVDVTIVQAITHLVDDLGMATVAEGIEREEQLDWLRRTPCRFVQGFHLHRPEPIPAFLARRSTLLP